MISMKKIAKSTKKYLLALTVILTLAVAGVATTVMPKTEAAPLSCGTACCGDPGATPDSPCIPKDELNKLSTSSDKTNADTKSIKCPNNQDCGGIITKIVNPLINLMTGLVGVVVAISLVVAAVTYSAAGGDPSKVSAAKKRITNSILALIAYIFTFGLLQWLVPGGLL